MHANVIMMYDLTHNNNKSIGNAIYNAVLGESFILVTALLQGMYRYSDASQSNRSQDFLSLKE